MFKHLQNIKNGFHSDLHGFHLSKCFFFSSTSSFTCCNRNWPNLHHLNLKQSATPNPESKTIQQYLKSLKFDRTGGTQLAEKDLQPICLRANMSSAGMFASYMFFLFHTLTSPLFGRQHQTLCSLNSHLSVHSFHVKSID